MRASELASIRQQLRHAASDLLGRDPSLPIDVFGICKDLGISVVQGSRGPLNAFFHSGGGKRVIELPRLTGPTKGQWRRFLVGHELGHYVLSTKCEVTHADSKEYWQLEDLCDEFARVLLVPERILRTYPASASDAGVLWDSIRLAHDCEVIWSAVAFRMSEMEEGRHFFRIEKREEANHLAIVVSTLPRKRETGHVLSMGTRFNQLATGLLETERRSYRRADIAQLDAQLLKESRIRAFKAARGGAAMAGRKSEGLLVAVRV